MNMEHYFIVETFDLDAFSNSMKVLHPQWSDKQCKCCLYWQNGVRKRLRQKCDSFIATKKGYTYTLIPEAMGVNVFRTAHRHKLMIRKNPAVVYKVALVGMARNYGNVDNSTQHTVTGYEDSAQMALPLLLP